MDLNNWQPQGPLKPGSASMNHSVVTADRNTHFKIAALALLAAIVVVMVGFSARVNDSGTVTAHAESNGPATKAGKHIQFSIRDNFEVR